MLLIKYDGITNVCDAIKHFRDVQTKMSLGTSRSGYYFIDDCNILKWSVILPDQPCYIYTSTQVSKWDTDSLIKLPIEIQVLARKYVSSDEDMKDKSVLSMTTWHKTNEGTDFWMDVSKHRFHKAFEYLATQKILSTNINTKENETKLQDKTSSSRTGAEPQGSIISCKKSIVTVTSGYLEYGRSIRG